MASRAAHRSREAEASAAPTHDRFAKAVIRQLGEISGSSTVGKSSRMHNLGGLVGSSP
jgi:hypothetical protein